MKESTDLGMNRTGIGTAPIESKKTIEGAAQSVPSSPGDASAIAAVRASYIAAGELIGHVPPPTSLKGAAKAGAQMLQGHKPTVLLDRLGERLAFERTGTRLYEGLITKFEAAGASAGADLVAPLTDLRRIRDEELAHFALLKRAVEQLGGDPTVQTPAADITAVEATGLLQVIADPRTTPLQSLHAILLAELADNEGWQTLITLADAMNQSTMATEFRAALREEASHLSSVRGWLAAGLERDAGVVRT